MALLISLDGKAHRARLQFALVGGTTVTGGRPPPNYRVGKSLVGIQFRVHRPACLPACLPLCCMRCTENQSYLHYCVLGVALSTVSSFSALASLMMIIEGKKMARTDGRGPYGRDLS